MAEKAAGGSRVRKAAIVIVPFFLLGAGNVVLVLQGMDPIWGLLLFPPVVFISVLGWVAISGGLVDRET
jgi:hypothetical protein